MMRHRRHRLNRRNIQNPSTNKNPVPATSAGTGSKTNPAVPPGLTPLRPPHPYHHTVVLITEYRSVAHRAGNPPSDCPPKSIHTTLSVPRSQLCAALCDSTRPATCSSSTVWFNLSGFYYFTWIKSSSFFQDGIVSSSAPPFSKKRPAGKEGRFGLLSYWSVMKLFSSVLCSSVFCWTAGAAVLRPPFALCTAECAV